MEIQEPPDPESDSSEELRRLTEESEKRADRRTEDRRAASAAKKAAGEARDAQYKRCLYARMQLDALELQRAVYRDVDGRYHVQWDGDAYTGEREYIDDATRASEVARVQQNIVTSCEDPDDAGEEALARRLGVQSERCASARADLEAVERNHSESDSRDFLERKRETVRKYCEM